MISASSPLGWLEPAKTDRGVSHEVNRRIIDYVYDDRASIPPGKIGGFPISEIYRYALSYQVSLVEGVA
jgi:hypothetical protein